MGSSYHLVIRLKSRSGRREALEDALVGLAAASRTTSPGCLGFVVARGIEADDELWLFESFRSRRAYDEHVVTPHAQKFLTETVPQLVAEREVSIFQPAASPTDDRR
jgi:quinol monooxygenase YgiN